jgi:hypothetical protein
MTTCTPTPALTRSMVAILRFNRSMATMLRFEGRRMGGVA